MLNVRRTPYYLVSQGQPLFTWLHHTQPAPRFNHGVVLCPPIGHEQVHAHRSWRVLADALAQAGFPVLRFDYHGTGDSAGSDEDADRSAVWLTNLRDAKWWMHKQLGCKQISMIGLRLGATLAMQFAATEEVENLVLWAPVVSGRAYVREMKALSLLAAAPRLPEAPDDLEPAGFVLTKQTADDLSKLDLLKVQPRCQRVLIMARAEIPQDQRLLDHLLAVKIDAEQSSEPGYAEMMAEPHYTEVPRQAIQHAVDWLLASKPADAGPGAKFEAPETCTMPQQPIRERVLSIGHDPELFGVLTEPADASTGSAPLIVLLNAGSAYRIGPSRLHVALARQLALAGFRSLRLDFDGLGDSAPTGGGDNIAYPASSFRDIDVTLKHLETHLGVKRVVLMGLCSGAYFAFQSAAQMSNPLLVESVLINPLTYFWKDGMSLENSPATEYQQSNYYWRAALQPRKWLKFFSGRTKTGLAGAIAALVQRWRRGSRTNNTTSGVSVAELGDDRVSHPAREDLAADLAQVAKRGRQIACFFSKSDPGYGIMTYHADRTVRDLLQTGKMSVSFFDADHTFSNRVPRRALVQAISDYLCGRYQPAGI